jgi:hypothetical protein
MEPGAEVAEPLRDGTLDHRMHILVGIVEGQAALGDPAADIVERSLELIRLLVCQEPRVTERARMGYPGSHVLRREPSIEVQRPAERVRLGRGGLGEPPTPRHASSPCTPAHTLSGSPARRTYPRASD